VASSRSTSSSRGVSRAAAAAASGPGRRPAGRGAEGRARTAASTRGGDPRIEPGAATGDGTDRGGELLGRAVLEDESVGPCLQRPPEHVVVVEGGQYQDADRLAEPAQLPGGVDAVQPGHPHVHQHDVGPVLPDRGDRFEAVGAFGDHDDVRFRPQYQVQAGADHRLVVGEHHPDVRRHARSRLAAVSGSRQETTH
jgi:hypothetical protein